MRLGVVVVGGVVVGGSVVGGGVVGGGVGGGGVVGVGVGAEVTVSLTLTVWGLPVAPADAMLTVPL